MSEEQFGQTVLGDPKFVLGLDKGRSMRLDAADRVLRFMGEFAIGPRFRREIEAFNRTNRSSDSIHINKKNSRAVLRQLCSESERRARSEAERRCSRLGGDPSRDTFRVVEKNCEDGALLFASVTGTMTCRFIDSLDESYAEITRECSEERIVRRACPEEIVTKLE